MAESEWMIFLELIEHTCGEVERSFHSSDLSTLQNVFFFGHRLIELLAKE